MKSLQFFETSVVLLETNSIGGQCIVILKAHQNNEILVITNNNNFLLSLSDYSQGDGKQGILLCWP